MRRDTGTSSAAWPRAATCTSASWPWPCGDVSVEAAIPCPTQADGWPRAQQERYRRLVAACDYETLVQSSYSPGCMQRRNRYMVDHAALLLAVHDGQPGGTRRTMEYAMRRGLQIVDIPPVMEP